MNPNSGWKEELRLAVSKAVDDGYRANKIAEAIGSSPNAIHQFISKGHLGTEHCIKLAEWLANKSYFSKDNNPLNIKSNDRVKSPITSYTANNSKLPHPYNTPPYKHQPFTTLPPKYHTPKTELAVMRSTVRSRSSPPKNPNKNPLFKIHDLPILTFANKNANTMLTLLHKIP